MAQPDTDRPGSTDRTAEAYRALAKAMADHAHEEAFLLEPGSSAYAIYEDLFRSTAIHRKSSSGGWVLAPPTDSDWRAAWTAMTNSFDRAREVRVNLMEVASQVSGHAVTMDNAKIWILLIAGILTRCEDVVLYENHNLVAALNSEVAARITDNISAFSIENSQAGDGQRKALLDILGRRLQLPPRTGRSRLLDVTVALYRQFQIMPPYTLQTAQSISRDTLAIRQCFRGASKPDVLLFETLPTVLMIEPFSGPGPLSSVKAGEYTTGIFKAIRELHAAYPALLDRLQHDLTQAVLSEAISLPALREELTAKAQTIARRQPVPELEDFVNAITSSGNAGQWLESIAGIAAGGTSPREWADDTTDCFRAQIRHLGRMFCQASASP